MLSKKIVANLSKASWIRAMFEEGEKLRKLHGAENVFDFTLGNPDPEPPKMVKDTLKKLVSEDLPGLHRYMNNAGFLDVREKIAATIEKESTVPVSSKNIIMTCGAAGGLNVVLKTILNPAEEVIIFAPYFVEYKFYIDNHNGIPIVLPTNPENFEPNLEELEKNINSKTKAIIINSPNNPTGAVYSKELLEKMNLIIQKKENEFNSSIFVLSDEPYTKLIYDDIEIPSILKVFKNSIIVTSYSKSLSLPGERIGYIAVNPNIENIDLFISGLAFANRTLGFVNAPALFQKVIAESLNSTTDISIYKNRRDKLYTMLTKLGFSCNKPNGAFYLFPKSPIPDDLEFVKQALKYNILLVPGSGFECPGYFRISYCVSDETIENSFSAFEKLAADFF